MAVHASWGINNIVKKASDIASGLEFGPIDGENDDEYNGIGFVEIPKNICNSGCIPL